MRLSAAAGRSATFLSTFDGGERRPRFARLRSTTVTVALINLIGKSAPGSPDRAVPSRLCCCLQAFLQGRLANGNVFVGCTTAHAYARVHLAVLIQWDAAPYRAWTSTIQTATGILAFVAPASTLSASFLAVV